MRSYTLNIVVQGEDRASGPLGGVGKSLGGIGQIAGGILSANVLMGVASGIWNMGQQALNSYANYERLGMSLQSLTARELMQASAVKNTTTVTSLATQAQKDRAAWLQKEIALQQATVNAQEAGSDSLRKAQQRLAGLQGQLAALGIDQNGYITTTKTSTAQTMQMSEAMAIGATKAKELQAWMIQLAIKSPFTQEEVAQAFRMNMAYGFTIEQSKRLTQATMDFSAATGASGDAMYRISLALGQIQAKGKLAGQEVLQLTNAGLNVRDILAKSFGVTTDKLVEMQEKGLIPADKAIEAIVSSLEKDFGGAAAAQTQTFSGLLSSLKDIKDVGLREFFTGTFQAIQPMLVAFVDLFSSQKFMDGLRNTGAQIGAMISPLASVGLELLKAGPNSKEFMNSLLGMFDIGAKVQGLGGGIATFIAGLGGSLKDFLPGLRSAIVVGLPVLASVGVDIIRALFAAIVTALPGLIQVGTALVTGLLQAFVTVLPVLLPAGIQALFMIGKGLVNAIPQLVPVVAQILPVVVQTLATNAVMLMESGLNLLLTLANSIFTYLPQLIPAVMAIIPTVITTLISALPQLITVAVQLIVTLITGLATNIPVLVGYIPEIITAIVNALIVALPLIAGAAVEIILALIDGIGTMLPKIGETAGTIITTLGDAVVDLATTIYEVGADIVTGIWNGINDKATWFGEQVKQFFKNIIDGVKDLLGIASPSRVFAGIGENMALGLGAGFDDQITGVEKGVQDAINAISAPMLSPVITPSAAVPGPLPAVQPFGSAQGQGTYIEKIEIIVNGTTDPMEVARLIFAKLRAQGVALP